MDRPFTRLILRWFWDFWDNLLALCMMNLATCGLVLTIIGIPFGLGGIIEVAAVTGAGREPEWHDWRRGLLKHAVLGFLWLVGMLVSLASVVAAFLFYPSILGMPGYFLAGVTFWVGLGAMLTLLWWPACAARQNLGLGASLKMAGTLFLHHPFYSFYLGLLMLALLGLSAAGFPLMLPFITFGSVAVGVNAAWTVIMRQHTAAAHAAEEAGVPSGAARSWREIKRRETLEKQRTADLQLEDDEMQRSVREIFRPWDMGDAD